MVTLLVMRSFSGLPGAPRACVVFRDPTEVFRLMSYRLSPEAKKDLLAIRAYTRTKWGNQQAQKYLDALEKKCAELARSPHIGRERPEIKSGYRSLAERKHVIFYRVGDGGIDILRILHGRMDIEHRMGQTKTGTSQSK